MHAKKDTAWDDGISRKFSDGRKITGCLKMRMFEMLVDNPDCQTRLLIEQIVEIEGPVPLNVRHVNRLRLEWGLGGKRGRPAKREPTGEDACRNKELVEIRPRVSHAGLHLFDVWLDTTDALCETIRVLRETVRIYKDDNPDDSFPLLNHGSETLERRFKALLYAPLFGIGKLTEYDMKEHALETIIGRGYQSSTLNQFLGQLERVEAGEALVPALIPREPGAVCYIDGHMIAFWTKSSMHKGKITMLGRIMAGSNAVVSHNERGDALFFEFFPPDIRLPGVIMDYCEKIVALTGIRLFAIDREANSEEVAGAFEDRKWGLICMLDANQYEGLSDWDAEFIGRLEDGSKVWSGPWKEPGNDSRHFVIVEKEDRLLPFWGTPCAKEMAKPIEWPEIYRRRTEVQENSFKRMKAHGALDVNFGTKTIFSEDRHQARKREKLEKSSAAIRGKIEKKESGIALQEDKVGESKEKGHGKRLCQRENKLAELRGELDGLNRKAKLAEEKVEALGPPKQRADRDFRKQKVMTFRTLLLENLLVRFLLVLTEQLDEKISLSCLIELFFKRSGGYVETFREIAYWIDTDGLSLKNKRILRKVADGVCRMNLNRNGKPVRVELRSSPP